jgi:hypothetical protein
MAIAGGKGAPVLSEASARRFATGAIASDADFGPGSKYAMGVAVQPVDGVPCLHHTGGMVAFSSSFHADPAAGLAAFASVNARIGPYRPRLTTAYAIRLMRAARAGAPLPAAPDPLAPWRFRDPTPYLGRWVAPDGLTITVQPSAAGEQPKIMVGGEAEQLFRGGGGAASTTLGRHALAPASGGGLWWGETLLGREAPAPQPPVPERLRAFTGVYLNRNPWQGYAVILARGDQLVLESEGPIVDRGGYWTFEKDVGGLERAWFDGVLGGKATRLNVSGTDFIRLGA